MHVLARRSYGIANSNTVKLLPYSISVFKSIERVSDDEETLETDISRRSSQSQMNHVITFTLRKEATSSNSERKKVLI